MGRITGEGFVGRRPALAPRKATRLSQPGCPIKKLHSLVIRSGTGLLNIQQSWESASL
jgi:hypothetical protein